VHGGGGADAGGDQRLGAFLALDQHHAVGGGDARLVVERTRFGRGHLLAFGVPRPELLAPAWWVVAIDDRDQLAVHIVVVPLGGGRAQVVHRHLLARFVHRPGRCPPEQITRDGQRPGEIRAGIEAVVECNKVEFVAAVTGGAVRPESGLLADQHDLQAVARTAEDVADGELAAPLLAGGEQTEEHGFQIREKRGTNLLALGIEIAISGFRDGVEINHAAPPCPPCRLAFCRCQTASSESRKRTSRES